MAIQKYRTSKGDVRYKALVRDRGGHWMKSHSHERKIDAEREERRLLQTRDEGAYRPERYAPLSFSDAAKQWMSDVDRRGCSCRYKLRVANSVNRHLVPYFGNMNIKAIRPSDISRYIDRSLDNGTKASTINSVLKDLRTFLNFPFVLVFGQSFVFILSFTR